MIIDDDDLQNAVAADRVAQGFPPIAEDLAALRVLSEIVERALVRAQAESSTPSSGSVCAAG